MSGASSTSSGQWSGRRVLVTGAGGFIGSHLVERLVRSGAEVTAFVRYTSSGRPGSIATLPGDTRAAVRVVAGDLKDPAAVTSVVAGHDVVFHLAALIGIPYSYVHPIDYVQTNVVGTTYVLDACRRHEVAKLVQFSTSEVYGSARYTPIDEEHPVHGQSPYAASKIAADQLAIAHHRSFGLPVAIARPFNTFGPRQPARAIVPTIITQALAGGPVQLGSLEPTRDLTYVEDTVAGALRVAEVDATAGEIVNLGSGEEISVGDLARTAFELLGRDCAIVADPARVRPAASEVERLCASTEKARSLLGWKPAVPLREGLGRTIEWVRAHPDFFAVDGYHV